MIETPTDEIVLEALQHRRSMAVHRQERPSRELVERVIEAASWAPNHHKTEPWRFVILAGEERNRLGDVMVASLRNRLKDPDSGESQRALEKERQKPLRAPVLIAVWVCASEKSKAIEIEEVAATAAAVQTMLLAAEALGLGAMWRTGDAAYDPIVKRFLGIPDDAPLLSFMYLGFPAETPPRNRSRHALQYAEWRGWDDAL